MDQFVHLHLHTEYSLLDGATRINQLFKRCSELNMPAVAITDHGNMYGAYQFYLAAKKFAEDCKNTGMKPVKAIIGCEFYMTDDLFKKEGKVNGEFHHLVLLAKNNQGYKNLVKLNSIAFVDGFYYKPRIDFDTLSKYSEGVICLSACLGGEVPQLILAGRIEDAKKVVQKFADLFGEDYFLEMQNHDMQEQQLVNNALLKLSKETGVPLVATNDVHYLHQSDAESQDVLMCINMQKTLDDKNRLKFSTDELYLKSHDEMAELFSFAKEALENTVKIAEKCNVSIDKEELLPNYVPSTGQTPLEFFRDIMEEGLKNRYDEITEEIRQRAEYEFDVIAKMGFVEYYLIVWDFIHYAESIGVMVGPGRGSGAGSIIAYAIGITKIDPVKYQLLFERFLNPERVSMPDFDIDFRDDRRGEVIDYVIKKYGAPKVAQIVTFGTLKAKNAIKDVGRVLGVPYAERDKVTKLIPEGKVSLEECFGLKVNPKNPPIAELENIYATDIQMQKVVDISILLEEMPKNTSKHAAGVVICRDDIADHVPLQRNGDDITTQFNMKEVEKLGLLKMDFLGLRTLTDIAKTIELVEENKGVKVDFDKHDYDDKNVFELVSSGDTDAVFQLESGGMKKLMRELQPDSLEDIIAGISLYRPGPMDSIPDYIKRKNNPELIKFKHPMLKKTLEVTYGCMVYQEQVMQIVQDMAGYSLGQADIIRRAMGKKDEVEMNNQRQYFTHGKKDDDGNVLIEGAIARGVSESVAVDVFKEMTTFAQYAFNKSHAAAYAVIAYQTAFLKRYYLLEFLAAVLNNRIFSMDEVSKYIAYCKERNIKVLQPDINQSQKDFSVSGNDIRFGLMAIKNVGENVIIKIIEERNKNGDFKSMEDMLSRLENGVVNKRAIESMIKAGAFDCFGHHRSQLMDCYEKMMELAAAEKKQKESGQFSLFELMGQQSQVFEVKIPVRAEYNKKLKMDMEKEVLGMYVTGHPLDDVADKLKMFNFNTSMLSFLRTQEGEEEDFVSKEAEIFSINGRRVTAGGILTNLVRKQTKSNTVLAVGKLEDLYGSVEVIFFPKVYDKVKELIQNDDLVQISGVVNIRSDENPQIRVENARKWVIEEQQEKPLKETLYLKFDYSAELFAEVQNTLDSYKGNIDTVFVVDGKSVKAEEKVRECKALFIELNELLGESNVKLVRR